MVIGFSAERFYSLFVTAARAPREFACEKTERGNESSGGRVRLPTSLHGSFSSLRFPSLTMSNSSDDLDCHAAAAAAAAAAK